MAHDSEITYPHFSMNTKFHRRRLKAWETQVHNEIRYFPPPHFAKTFFYAALALFSTAGPEIIKKKESKVSKQYFTSHTSLSQAPFGAHIFFPAVYVNCYK